MRVADDPGVIAESSESRLGLVARWFCSILLLLVGNPASFASLRRPVQGAGAGRMEGDDQRSG